MPRFQRHRRHRHLRHYESLIFFYQGGKQCFVITVAQRISILPYSARTAFIGKIKQQKNRGYVIAGAGAAVALFAFYFLPYSATYTDTFGHETLTASNSGLGHGLLWLELLLALAALVVAARLVFGSNPFGMTTTSLATQTHWGGPSIDWLGYIEYPDSACDHPHDQD